MLSYFRILLIFTTVSGWAFSAHDAVAQEHELKKVIAVQKATISSQTAALTALQAELKALQKRMADQEKSFTALSKQVVLKDSNGRAIADYASTSGSAAFAERAGTATAASEASICNRLKSEGGGNSVGVTWEGSSLFFNIDGSNKVKKL